MKELVSKFAVLVGVVIVLLVQALKAAAFHSAKASRSALVGTLLIVGLVAAGSFAYGRTLGPVRLVEVPTDQVITREVVRDVPGPTVTVTRDVPRDVPGPTVTREVTPPSCIEALDLAAIGFGLAASAISILNDAVQAAGRQNAAGVLDANRRLLANNELVNANAALIRAPTASCRSGAS
jgi:hypothetical protein